VPEPYEHYEPTSAAETQLLREFLNVL